MLKSPALRIGIVGAGVMAEYHVTGYRKAGAEVVDTYIRYLACGVVNLINIFQPEVLCIGGGVCNEGDYLLKPLLEIVANEQYSRHSVDKTAIKIAKLGNDAGIIGAAMLSL